jgi:hypothetical protein
MARSFGRDLLLTARAAPPDSDLTDMNSSLDAKVRHGRNAQPQLCQVAVPIVAARRFNSVLCATLRAKIRNALS